MRLPLLCFAVLAAIIAACEFPDQKQKSEPAAVEPESETPVARTQPPEAKPKPPVQPPPPRPSLEPQILIGQGEDEVTRILGEPRQVRNDPPAMVWTYGVNECKMDLFFYLDLKSQDFRALAYNFEQNTTSEDAKRACLARIQEVNRERRR